MGQRSYATGPGFNPRDCTGSPFRKGVLAGPLGEEVGRGIWRSIWESESNGGKCAHQCWRLSWHLDQQSATIVVIKVLATEGFKGSNRSAAPSRFKPRLS